MKTTDRMKLVYLAMNDLSEAVKLYEKEAEKFGERRWLFNIPRCCTKEAIKRRITQIRQDLLLLEKEL